MAAQIDETLVLAAARLLLSNPEQLADARDPASVGDTTAAGVLCTTNRCPRWVAENAVREAISRISLAGAGRGSPPGKPAAAALAKLTDSAE